MPGHGLGEQLAGGPGEQRAQGRRVGLLGADDDRGPEAQVFAEPAGQVGVDAARMADLDTDQPSGQRLVQQPGDLEPADLELVGDLDLGAVRRRSSAGPPWPSGRAAPDRRSARIHPWRLPSVQNFDAVFVITAGGLGTANLPYVIYQLFYTAHEYGRASAAGVIVVIATIIIATFALRTVSTLFREETR